MKKRLISTNSAIVFFVLTFLTVSCSKNDILESESTKSTLPSRDSVISNKLGILEFKDADNLIQTIEKLKTLNKSDRLKWEKENSFISLKTVYEEVIKSENDFLTSLNTINAKSQSKFNLDDIPNEHSEVFKTYSSSLISTGSKAIDTPFMNIGNTDYSTIVNKDGFVRIGNALLQFKNGYTKILSLSSSILTSENLVNLENAQKENSIIKILYSKLTIPKNYAKNSKVSQDGNEQCGGSIGSRTAFCNIHYASGFMIVPSGTPGAVPMTIFQLYFREDWVVENTMRVISTPFFGGISPESNFPVTIDGAIVDNQQNSTFTYYGNTDSDGIATYTRHSYDYNIIGTPITLLNIGFYFRDTGSLLCSVYKNY